MNILTEDLRQARKSRRIPCLGACLALFTVTHLLGQNAYITNVTSKTVSVIATATNTVTATIPVGSNPLGVAVTPDGSKVYVANNQSNNVSVITAATNTVTATIPVGSGPLGVAVTPDGSKVYVANNQSNNVSVIATATNTVTATIPVGRGPFGIAVTPDGSTVYVANLDDGTVSVIATATNTVTATIPVGNFPFGVAVTPDGSKVYVANYVDTDVGSLSVIATATNTITATIPVGRGPWGVAVTPDGSKVYVASDDGTVSVIATATNTVTATIFVGIGLRGVAVTPDGSKVYVANIVSNTVSVIATAGNAVTNTVLVGSEPAAFGQFIGPTPTVVGTVSVTPNSGSGVGPQVFRAVYSDTNGAADLQVMYLDFGSVGDAPHDCKVAFAQGTNALYLFNDANTGALGPITLGGGGSLSNSQCTLFGGGTTSTPSGNNLTVPFTIQFLAGYGGLKNIFGMAQSYNGTKSANGAFQALGTWTPAASTPSVVSVSPNSGSGAGPQVFTAVYSDTGGANDLQAVYLDFGSVGFAAHNCIAVYVPGPNSLYLFTDDNSNAVGPIAEGAGGGSISNSQCTLSSGVTPATLSGTNLTVPFNITFKSGYGGKKTIFGLAQTYAAVQSNGGVLTSLGSWEPALTTPGAVSVSPSSGSGFGPTTFTATYSDTGGANDLQVVYLSFGASFLAAHSCNVGYQPGNNQLLLFSDDNSTAATVGENGAGSVSNSQCTLSGGNIAAVISGTGATVPFTITFKAGFTGTKIVFGLAQSYDGTQSAITLLGSWTP